MFHLRCLAFACLALLVPGPAAVAGPLEDAIVAAMRLSEQSCYTWTTTVTDDARTYEVSGQTTKDGFTRVRMPVVNAVRRRLGRSVTDTQVEFIFRGNVAWVVSTNRGWMTFAELPPAGSPAAAPAGGIAGAGTLNFPRVGVGAADDGHDSAQGGGPPHRRYSNLQMSLSHPHEELGVIVSSHSEMRWEDDTVTGALTELGAGLLLVRDGQNELTPLRAAGTFRLWLHDGIVAKYQLRLTGVLQVATPANRRQVTVTQVADTVVKEIGTTKFDVPDEAKSKLLRPR